MKLPIAAVSLLALALAGCGGGGDFPVHQSGYGPGERLLAIHGVAVQEWDLVPQAYGQTIGLDVAFTGDPDVVVQRASYEIGCVTLTARRAVAFSGTSPTVPLPHAFGPNGIEVELRGVYAPSRGADARECSPGGESFDTAPTIALVLRRGDTTRTQHIPVDHAISLIGHCVSPSTAVQLSVPVPALVRHRFAKNCPGHRPPGRRS